MESIDVLTAKLQKLQKDIEEYQKNCHHKDTKIKMTNRNEPRWFCNDCNLLLRIPTTEEVTEWVKK